MLLLHDRAGGGVTEAERQAHRGVDVLGRRDTLLDQPQSLAHQRALDAVAEEADHVLLDLHRPLAERAHDCADFFCGRDIGVDGAHDLDQRDQVGGHEEVQPHHAPLRLQPLGDFADREAG